MNTLSKTSRIIQTEHTYIQKLEGEAVLLNVDNNQYYRLDEESYRMFSVLISSSDAGTAYKKLVEEYDVPPQELWQDLEEFVATLAGSGLIMVLNASME